MPIDYSVIVVNVFLPTVRNEIQRRTFRNFSLSGFIHIPERMIDVNIKGVLYGMAAVYKHMEEWNEGHIINFSSIAGHIIFPSSSIYSATKHAVRVFTEGMRTELGAQQNIRTTLISPGAVKTELYDTITDNSIYQALENLGSKEWNQLDPSDIARTVLFAIQQPTNVMINELTELCLIMKYLYKPSYSLYLF